MDNTRNYSGEVLTANIDAVNIGATAIPASMFLEKIQTEFETGKAPEITAQSGLVLRTFDFLCDQSIVDWKGVTLASGAFIATSVYRGLEARKKAEYQDFMMKSEMEFGEDKPLDKIKGRLVRGAAIIGAYVIGTKLNFETDIGGAIGITGMAVCYGAIQVRKMGWNSSGKKKHHGATDL